MGPNCRYLEGFTIANKNLTHLICSMVIADIFIIQNCIQIKLSPLKGRVNRLELAKELGATATINSRNGNVAEKISEITGKGVQHVLDTTGVDMVVEQAILSLDAFGKIATVVTDFSLNIPLEILALKGGSIVGTSQGDAIPQKFIPEMISYYKKGQFPYDRMVKFYDFEQINKAFEESENGSVIKPVLKIK